MCLPRPGRWRGQPWHRPPPPSRSGKAHPPKGGDQRGIFVFLRGGANVSFGHGFGGNVAPSQSRTHPPKPPERGARGRRSPLQIVGGNHVTSLPN
ncbi:hypothetical protein RRG08_057370 [Elysia crispata]|uniref:Uncharacterized protein n=1 Tax=Elysia crispata TaxID=231223 RepID=A0AAE0YJR5_9GAST|nr:hypothetical protein RRG08_057370 [Elysia crispata]